MESPSDIVVGQTYMVPHVDGVPVHLPAHIDHDCVFTTVMHYHIDGRFTNSSVQAIGLGGEPVLAPAVALRSSWNTMNLFATTSHAPQFFMINKLHQELKDVPVRNGVCPHKGTKLTNACGTCPAHGLVWNLQSNLLQYKAPFVVELRHGDKVIGEEPIGINECVIIATEDVDNIQSLVVQMRDSEGKHYPFKLKLHYSSDHVHKGQIFKLQGHCKTVAKAA